MYTTVFWFLTGIILMILSIFTIQTWLHLKWSREDAQMNNIQKSVKKYTDSLSPKDLANLHQCVFAIRDVISQLPKKDQEKFYDSIRKDLLKRNRNK